MNYQREYTTTARDSTHLTDLEVRGMALYATRVAVESAGRIFKGAVLNQIRSDPQTRLVMITPNPLLLELACAKAPTNFIDALEALERAYLHPKKAMPAHPLILSDGRVPCDACDTVISIYEAEGNYPRWSRMICNTCATGHAAAATRQ